MFTDPETRYTTHEKEVLTIVRAIEKYMLFLRPKHFIVYTDSSYAVGFRDLNLNKLKTNRLIRWQQTLNDSDFNIIHIKGKKNTVPDIIPREPVFVENLFLCFMISTDN